MKKIKQIGCQLGVDAIELTCADFRQNSQQFYLTNDFSIKKTKVFICESFKNELMGGGSRYDGVDMIFYPKALLAVLKAI